ncbi:MAG: hypothetical protein Q4A78_00520 [Peptostreptococcaceae bacterium]|nr:hypothetical protein [Peptostreptococcaceae bacterium]
MSKEAFRKELKKILVFLVLFLVYEKVNCLIHPLLNIETGGNGYLIWAGDSRYHVLCANSCISRRTTFERSKVERYQVDETNEYSFGILMDLKEEEDPELYRIISEIIEQVKSKTWLHNPDIGTLYRLDGRYFFTVFTNERFLQGYYSILYEYHPEKKQLTCLAYFRSRLISHIELCKWR